MVKTASRVLNHHHLWPSNTSRLIFSKRSVVCWCDHWLTWRRFHLPRQQPIDHLRAAFFTSSIRERGVLSVFRCQQPLQILQILQASFRSPTQRICQQVHLQTVHLPPKMSATQLTDHHKFTSMSSSTSRFCLYLPVRLLFNSFQEKPLRS